MVKFTVPLKIIGKKYGLNEIYKGIHWSVRKKTAEEIHELMYYSMMAQHVPKKLFKRPVVISISYNSNLDCDNHGYLTKMLVDGLKGYLIEDDKREFVDEIRQKFYDGKDILIEIWEVDNN